MSSFVGNFSKADSFSPHSPPILEASYLLSLGLAFSLGFLILCRVTSSNGKSEYPLVTLDKDINNPTTDRLNYRLRGNELLEKGRTEHPDQPFRVISENGDLLVLPPRLANEIRNLDELSFMESLKQAYHASLPGFEPFQATSRTDQLIQTVSRKQMTKSLNQVTQPLSDETAYALELCFGEANEWTEYNLFNEILDIVARTSTRAFLGEQVCRNEDWLNISKSFAVQAFKAASSLRRTSLRLRFLFHWFDPECRKVRNFMAKSRKIIAPVIQERQKVRREALARGLPVPTFNDAMDWFEDEAQGRPYDPAILQLTISMVAIHTTNDLICETVTNIARNPELFPQLREEISRVLRVEGWKKTALSNLKLLDSVVKESQRLKPVGSTSQSRIVTSSVTLSDGTHLPKGTHLTCDAGLRLSDAYYPDPLRFDGARHLAWRDTPGKETLAHLVSTSPENMGFGHGQHSCPGRFFAANEIKIAMCHLLMKYDWKLVEGCDPKTQPIGLMLNTDPTTRILIKKREHVELDIDDLEIFGR